MTRTIAIDARKVEDFGIGTYIRSLVRELAEIDSTYRYLLLVGPQGRDAFGDLPDNFETVPERAPVYSVREQVSVSFSLLRRRADLYHATHYVLPLLVPCRSIVTIHDIIHLLYPEFLPHRFAHVYAERMIRRSLMHGDRVITVSHNTRNDLKNWFGVDGSRIEVVYNGIDPLFRRASASLSTTGDLPNPVQDDPETTHWLETFGLEPGYLLFVGNPKPHKNLDRVVQAYARAVERDRIEAPLVCVGDRTGTQRKVQMRADQLGITDRLVFLGHVPQEALPALYRSAALFLYPTLYEGFGLPVVEAMASNVPVLTSNTSALKEIAADYAHLVDPLDVDAMADGIVRCLRDDALRKRLRKAGRRRARDFTWRRAAEKTLALYERTLNRSKDSTSSAAESA
ncbi:MAG: glycosyltransferase family 1 protein [Acidobacteriota bacterium]